PYISRLYNSGSQILDRTDLIIKKYEELNTIDSNCERLHQLYRDFTKIVLPNSNDSNKANQKLLNQGANFLERKQFGASNFRNLEESRDRYIIINASYKNLGNIADIGQAIPEMFGYSQGELINRNLNILMPKIFAEVHDRLLSTYLLNTSEKMHDSHKNRIIFPLHKDGYIIPCYASVYILPSLREGIKLAAFIQELDDGEVKGGDDVNEDRKNDTYYVVFDADTHLLQGVSHNCWASFGISSRFIEGNEGINDVGIEDLFVEFGGLDMEKLKCEEGIETTLDTSKLSQYHLISEQVLKELGEGDEQEEEEKRFRKARVQVKMVSEADYFGNRVQVLRFQEVYKEGKRVKIVKVMEKQDLLSPTNKLKAQDSETKEEQSKENFEEKEDEVGEHSRKSFIKDF
ncbi:MAG: PAS domain S-box protein, partial [Flavobacterium sp.]